MRRTRVGSHYFNNQHAKLHRRETICRFLALRSVLSLGFSCIWTPALLICASLLIHFTFGPDGRSPNTISCHVPSRPYCTVCVVAPPRFGGMFYLREAMHCRLCESFSGCQHPPCVYHHGKAVISMTNTRQSSTMLPRDASRNFA